MRLRLTSMDRRLFTLAIPALGALVAEPLFVLTDTAMVGHLGEIVLAGMSIGSTVMQTIVGLCVFLAYTTTPMVARRLGADDRPGAIRAGIDGLWLGGGLGVVLLLVGLPLAGPIARGFAPDPFVAEQAYNYIVLSLWGLPGMLLVVAGTGLLRGLQDTRTPLLVALGGAIMNALLNWVLIYPANLGISGSALGTAIAQTLMALVYIAVAARAAASAGVSMGPGIGDPRESLVGSTLMLVRTITLRASLVLFVWAAAQLGVTELAALQITLSLYMLLVNALDALAIAAQAMIGHDLGAGDAAGVRASLRRMNGWGVVVGAVVGILIIALSPVLGGIFTSDTAVLEVLPAGFITIAAFLPLCGIAFVLDGVLIGAGDVRYLAFVGILPLITWVVAVAIVLGMHPAGPSAMVALWLGYFIGFMVLRGLTLLLRARTDAWLVVGHGR